MMRAMMAMVLVFMVKSYHGLRTARRGLSP
jgi:hypothetical protein